eukprot:jgi/Mesen1/7434/ME000388S06654
MLPKVDTCLITGLTPGTQYVVAVAAVTSAGHVGATSAQATCRTFPAGPPLSARGSDAHSTPAGGIARPSHLAAAEGLPPGSDDGGNKQPPVAHFRPRAAAAFGAVERLQVGGRVEDSGAGGDVVRS